MTCVFSENPTNKGDKMYDTNVTACGECGGEVEEFMMETYNRFTDKEDDLDDYLCSSCLHEVSGE